MEIPKSTKGKNILQEALKEESGESDESDEY